MLGNDGDNAGSGADAKYWLSGWTVIGRVPVNNVTKVSMMLLLSATTSRSSTQWRTEPLTVSHGLNISIQVRKGGGSFISQMWDQVFNKFGVEYQKHMNAVIRYFESTSVNPRNIFRMTKQTVLSALYSCVG